jgi:hypothetical protein
MVAVLGIAYALVAQEWVQDLIKAQVSTAISEQQARGRKQREAVEKSVEELTRRVAAQQAVIDGHERSLAAQQAKADTHQQVATSVMDAVQQLRQQLTQQGEQLQEITTVTQDLLGGAKTEEFVSSDGQRLIVRPRDNERGTVYLQLSQAPRPGTVAVQWQSTAFGPSSFKLQKNIVVLEVAKDIRRLARAPFSVRYVPDTSSKQELATLSVVGDAIYINGERAPELTVGAESQ